MIRQSLSLAALLLWDGNALACTAEAGRIAVEAREDRRTDLRSVRGAYQLLSVTRRSEQRFGQAVEVATYRGRITVGGNRTFETMHEDDSSIDLCGGFDTPVADARGTFFLARRPGAEARYQLIDWDGSYLQSPVRETEE